MSRANSIIKAFNEDGDRDKNGLIIDPRILALKQSGDGPDGMYTHVNALAKAYKLSKVDHKKLYDIVAKVKKVVNPSMRSLLAKEFQDILKIK